MSDSNFLSLAEIANEFSVSYWSVYRWVHAGQMRCIRLPSGTLRVPREELERLKAADLEKTRVPA